MKEAERSLASKTGKYQKLQAFDSSYLLDKTCFEDDGTSKWFFEEKVKLSITSGNSFDSGLIFNNNASIPCNIWVCE